MESLLRWGITNSTPADANRPPPQPRTDLDPGIIDAILGKSDAVLMKEALGKAVDEKLDEDERVQALDDFEMLVEQIDNANNLEKLKMWEPLHALLTNPTSSEEIQRHVLWVLGTAVQNNPSAQDSYLALSPLRTLLTFPTPETARSAKTRSRAVYTLSGLLKHNAAAVQAMHDLSGWTVFADAFQDSDIAVRRKVAFLLNTLLIPAPSIASAPPSSSTSTSTSSAPAPVSAPSHSQSQPQSQVLTLHPSESTSTTATASTNVTTEPPPSAPVHPNSHASMVRDPSSFATSPGTVRALEADDHALLRAVVGALAAPTPHGPDGDATHDEEAEEKLLRTLHTYAVGCGRGAQMRDGEKRAVRGWLEGAKGEAGSGDVRGLAAAEVRELEVALA